MKIKELMERDGFGVRELSRLTDVRANTVLRWRNGDIQRFDVVHINKLCRVFNCQPNDLMEYVPDEQ